MDTISYKTLSANRQSVDKRWILVDAAGQNLGRLASKVARVIRGKHKPDFTPHVDCGDNVVVINAEKINLTGEKWEQKKYVRHTGYPGGQRIISARHLAEKHPERIVEKAIKGMLPKNRLGAKLFKNLRVFAGHAHDRGAQKPERVNLDTL